MATTNKREKKAVIFFDRKNLTIGIELANNEFYNNDDIQSVINIANRRIREAGYCDEGKMEIYSDGTKRILWTFPDGCEDDLEFAYQDILKNVSAE